ncbi:MAG: hypothetical protein SFY96_11855 [Planctomycetota bacterium]|nr:hypothetical protein [Planctomycetota bacterium]
MGPWRFRIPFVIGVIASELTHQRWGTDAYRTVAVIVTIVMGLLYALRRVDEYSSAGIYGYPLAAGFVVWALAKFAFNLAWEFVSRVGAAS